MHIHWSQGIISVGISANKAVTVFLWWTELRSWPFRLKYFSTNFENSLKIEVSFDLEKFWFSGNQKHWRELVINNV